jgi:formate-nitrite transporter family protein
VDPLIEIRNLDASWPVLEQVRSCGILIFAWCAMAQFLSVPVSSSDHILGPSEAAVTLVEYGDFECPNCAAAFPVVRNLLRSLDGQLRFVFRHFPVSIRHDHAQKAAEASEAAAAQGKFWEMHDILFRNQDDLDRESLLEYAGELNLDLARFTYELDESIHAERVFRDLASGEASAVSWTPTFFLNEVRHGVARDLDGLVREVAEQVRQRAGSR